MCGLQNTSQCQLWPIAKSLATHFVKLFDGTYLRQVNNCIDDANLEYTTIFQDFYVIFLFQV
jgi:hypothetical protein